MPKEAVRACADRAFSSVRFRKDEMGSPVKIRRWPATVKGDERHDMPLSGILPLDGKAWQVG